MKLTKPSAALITEFKWVQGQLPRAEPRKMFGYDALFVNGNMAVGLWQDTCVMKLSTADQAELLKRGDAKPFAPMPGRAMTGWLELTEELAHDPETLLAWSERAVTHVATLPPKLRKSSVRMSKKQLATQNASARHPALKTSAKKSPVKKTSAKKTSAKKGRVTKTSAKKSPAKRASAQKQR
jgi:TfoX/Sxy family transcriptional regulator of competence genes